MAYRELSRRRRRAITRALRPRRGGSRSSLATTSRAIRSSSICSRGWRLRLGRAWAKCRDRRPGATNTTRSASSGTRSATPSARSREFAPCNGVTIATNCPLNRPEYGDPWDIMGNVSSRHVNAWQKNDMGWVPDRHRDAQGRDRSVHAVTARNARRRVVCGADPRGDASNLLDRVSSRPPDSTPGCRPPRPMARSFTSADYAPGRSQRVWLLGYVLSRHGAVDGDDGRRRAAVGSAFTDQLRRA